MEADVSGRAPGDEALAVLRRQSALFDEQIGLARNERFRNRIKAVRDMALSAVVLGLVVGLGVVLWNAHRAEGLVVEAFATPPEMAATGLDGSVLAARLLDRLSAMQAGTDSSRAPSTFGNNWGDDLAVELPQTGMSVGEAWRMLRQTLGDETRLSGDLTRAADGTLTLTTRVGANPGVAVSGGTEELDRLLDEAARAVYRQAQPYRYTVWLERNGGGDDAEVLAELAASSDKTERLWALAGQSVRAYSTDPLLTVALAREALALDPSFHKARWNLSDGYVLLGWHEADLHESREIARVMRRRDPRVTKAAQDQVLYGSRGSAAQYLGDHAVALENARIRFGLPDYGGAAQSAGYQIVAAHIGLHDLKAARAALSVADRRGGRAQLSLFTGAALAAEAGEPARAIALVRQLETSTPPAGARIVRSATEQAEIARILTRAGDADGAEAVLLGLRDDCYPCAVARAEVAVLRGRRAEAIRLFRHATTLGPSLPQAWQAWGQARMDWGDPEAARLAFRQARRLGPRWADPLKGEADALMALDRAREAEGLYARAATRAPNWGGLHLAWGRALERLGRRDRARETYRRAATLDLTPAERAEIERLGVG